MADRVFAVVGETIELYVEAEAHFSGDVLVSFAADVVDNETKVQDIVLFDERLRAEKTAVRTANAPPSVRASLIKWKVNVAKDERFLGRTATLAFTVEGDDEQLGLPLRATSANELRIVSIGVTKNAACMRIMLHEFPKQENGTLTVDRDRLLAVVEALTPAQRRLLVAHAKAKPEGRLVVFLTLIPSGDRRMFADFGGGRESVVPNASFAVFACRDLETEGISLVCFTEHFLINTKNGPTRELLASRQGGKPPTVWRSRDNAAPPKFRIASQLPLAENDGVIWSCLYASNGKNVMRGNTIHGIINTIGCWMLFRNYNWPVSKAREFERLYMRMRQMQAANASVAAIRKFLAEELVKLGYDVVKPAAGEANSSRKYMTLDHNWAYPRFFHDIVGIKYFARTWMFGGPDPLTHERNPAGLDFEPTMKVAELGQPTPTNTPDEEGCTMHDFERRLRNPDKSSRIPIDDTLFRPNVLGFSATRKFIPQTSRFGDMSAAELEACSWADVYLYDGA